MAGFKGAIFDMDGTLLESMLEWRKQNTAFCERHGVPVPEQLIGRELDTSSHKAARLYEELYPQLGMKYADIIKEYEDHLYPMYISGIPMKKGVLPFLEMLAGNNVRMCVATATPADIARAALKHNGIAKYMDFIISADTVGVTKSSESYFPRVAELLGLPSDDCVVFEDALYAVSSAVAAGMRVFAVKDFCARNDWPAIAEKAVVLRDDFTGLLPVVEAMFAADHVCTMHIPCR